MELTEVPRWPPGGRSSSLTAHFPVTTSVEKVRSYLGLTGYNRQFIRGYADIAHPLTSLLKRGAKFHCGPEQQNAFETLKVKLISAPVLILPDYTREFILCTDASDIGLGGILMQERNGKPQPIPYASRLCTSAERNYSITERETLAVIYCLERFRDMILDYKVKVWTDHTAIQSLFKHKNLRSRLARWFMTLQKYEVTFEYIPGKKNAAADALSRNIREDTTEGKFPALCNVELTALDETLISSEQRKEEPWKSIIDFLENSTEETPLLKLPEAITEEFAVLDKLLYKVTDLKNKKLSRKKVKQLVIPKTIVPDVLRIIQDSVHSSHPDKDKSYKRAQLKYYWPCMRKDIYTYVDNCYTCARIKGYTQSPAPMLTYPVPQKPWQRVHIDTLELTMSENRFKYFFVATDYFQQVLHTTTNVEQKG